MMHREKHNRGGALLIVLILLGIMSVAGVGMLASSRSGFLWGRFFQAKNVLEAAADTGKKLAQRDLSDRAKNRDFVTTADCLTAIRQGLVYYESEPGVSARTAWQTRISNVKDGIELKVWYIPDEKNPGYDVDPCSNPAPHNNEFPKYFTVASMAKNQRTGEVHTIETRIKMRFESFSEMSYGLLGPVGYRPGGYCQYFFAGTYSGHVHLGFSGYPLFKGEKFVFNGPVTFLFKPEPGTLPFKYDPPATTIEFRKGYKEDFKMDYDLEKYFTGVQAAQNTPAIWQGQQLCLKFTDDGLIHRHDCVETLNPLQRYGAEIPPAVSIPPGGLVIYSPENVHVKGILKGQVTVASEKKVVLEGDVQYADQGKDTADMFGAVARDDLLVPFGVPQNQLVEFKYPEKIDGSYDDLWGTKYEGVTNFTVPNDRDLENPDYDCAECAPGWAPRENLPQNLDLDGAYLTFKKVDIQGLNYDFDGTHLGGMGIPAWDPADPAKMKIYKFPDQSDTDPDAYFYATRDPVTNALIRRADPVYCRTISQTDSTPRSPCLIEDEVVRPGSSKLALFGSLVEKDFNNKRSEQFNPNTYNYWKAWVGFEEKMYNFDERFLATGPLGFPLTGNVITLPVWSKSFHGTSALIP